MAKRLSDAGGDVSRRALEAIALQGYRDQALTLYQISEMLRLSRVETEDFLGRHHVPLSEITEGAGSRGGTIRCGVAPYALASSRHDRRFQYHATPVTHRHWPRRPAGKAFRESVRTYGCA